MHVNGMLSYSLRTPFQLGLNRSITVLRRIAVLSIMSSRRGIRSSAENPKVEVDMKLSNLSVGKEKADSSYDLKNEEEFPTIGKISNRNSKRLNTNSGVIEVEQKAEQRLKEASSPQPNNDTLDSHSKSYPPKLSLPSALKEELVCVEQSSSTSLGNADESPNSSDFNERQSSAFKSGSSHRTALENGRNSRFQPSFQPGRQHDLRKQALPVREEWTQMDRTTPVKKRDSRFQHFDINPENCKMNLVKSVHPSRTTPRKPVLQVRQQWIQMNRDVIDNSEINAENSGTPSRTTPEIKRDKRFRPFDICFNHRRHLALQRPVKEQGTQTDSYIIENGEILRPGMVLLRGYLSLNQQVDIILRCRELGIGPGGFYRPGYKDGAKLNLQMMCLGQDWDPETRKYGTIRQHDNSKPPDIPLEFTNLIKRSIHDAHRLVKMQTSRNDVENILPDMTPDICIVNFYTTNGRLGLHQDRDESRDSISRGLPVVSFSIGDSAEFLYGDERKIDEAECVKLESGDVLIFGGKSRSVFHGVNSIEPRTTPKELREQTNLRSGRLNLTFRQY